MPDFYFRGSMTQFWNVIYAEYQRLHASLGYEPFRFFSPPGLLGGHISEYAPEETDKISITFCDDGYGLDVISLEVECSRTTRSLGSQNRSLMYAISSHSGHRCGSLSRLNEV